MALSKIRSDSIADTAVTGRRNVVINGGFQIWQRSTSQTTVGIKSADRWYYNPSGATGTFSRQSFTDGQTDVPGNPKYYSNLNITTGNDNAGLQYRVEGTHKFANDVYTLSFWAKSDTARELTIVSQGHDLSADVFENNTVSPTTFTPTSSWQKFTFKITHADMDTLGSFASGDYTRFSISQGSDTSTSPWELDLAQVQLEKGEIDTIFEQRSDAEELILCQRYYQKSFPQGTTPTHNSGKFIYRDWTNYASTDAVSGETFQTQMRADPSMTYWTSSSSSNSSTGRVSFYDGAWKNAAVTHHSSTNPTSFQFNCAGVNNNLKLIQYNFEADAEL